MNYKLAKQLKNAGFPQTGLSRKFPSNGDRPEDQIYAPTLEELINACDKEFINLYNFGPIWQCNFKDGMGGEVTGQTPVEAVAMLWLKVNEK